MMFAILFTFLGLLATTNAKPGWFNYCYSCSSVSALCRYSVYDVKYLSASTCKTKCFLRTEGNKIYRGCFDGWRGGVVSMEYQGCRRQRYLGQDVEWCFCEGNLCNGASRDALAKTALPPPPAPLPKEEIKGKEKEEEGERKQEVEAYVDYETSFRRMPMRPVYDEDTYSHQQNTVYEVPYSDYVEPETDKGKENAYEPEVRDDTPIFTEEARGRTDYKDATNEDSTENTAAGNYGYEQRSNPVYRICGSSMNQVYPDLEDCSRYYHCSNGYSYLQRCPRGTVFNRQLKTCDFPQNVFPPCRVTYDLTMLRKR